MIPKMKLEFQFYLLVVFLLCQVFFIESYVISKSDIKEMRFLEESHNKTKESIHTTTPFSSWSNSVQTLVYALAFIIVLMAAHPLGLLFPRHLKLPLITGYLIVGIIAGPFVTNLLTAELVKLLATSINAMALSFISFQAGQEIYLPELRPQIKGILQLLVVLYGVTMVILTSVLTLGAGPFFYGSFDGACQLAIGLMFGSIAVLGSPATVMAIKIELNSVGPFTNLMLGATMTAEFVVLVSFSISRIVSSVYCAKLDITVGNLLFTLGVVASNLLLGALTAGLIILIFKIPGGPQHQGHHLPDDNHSSSSSQSAVEDESSLQEVIDPDQVPHPHNAYVEARDISPPNRKKQQKTSSIFGSLYFKGFLWLFVGYVFYVSTTTISEVTKQAFGHVWETKFEALLVLMVASCLAGHYGHIRHDMHVILDTAAPYIFLPFFVMTGAALKLDQVAGAVPLMSLYVVLRYVSIFLACYVAGRFILKLPPQQYNNLWLTMTPQAGVALGLANEVKGLSNEPWAAEFAATIVAAVVVNQIIGPVLCAMGLNRAGESHHHEQLATKEEEVQTAITTTTDLETGSGSGSSGTGPAIREKLLPFYKVERAVVVGEDATAFELALELSLYGAQVNVPLLDEELAAKWHAINEAILARSAKGELISYKNKLLNSSRNITEAIDSSSTRADVIIFTGDPERAIEQVKTLQSSLGVENCPRFIAIIPNDPTFSKPLKDLGVLIIQPSIALANIATRMALLDLEMAKKLSDEISTTSSFSTASYFLEKKQEQQEEEQRNLRNLRLSGRRLSLGRSVVNHNTINYERVADALAGANMPLPPPPPRVSMFGRSANGPDPFAKRKRQASAYEYFVIDPRRDDNDEEMDYIMGDEDDLDDSQERMSRLTGYDQFRPSDSRGRPVGRRPYGRSKSSRSYRSQRSSRSRSREEGNTRQRHPYGSVRQGSL